ncbi:MAG: hypothetical protein RL701_5968 [Pseudomonadota bacterium]
MKASLELCVEVLGVIAVFAITACAAQQSTPTQNVQSTVAPTPPVHTAKASPAPPSCKFDPSWLDTDTLPSEVGEDDCSFHQFMWRSFVYLAKSGAGRARFETWMPTYGVFVDKPNAQPAAWGTVPPTPCTAAASGKKNAPASEGTAKPLLVYSSITKQAGVEQPLIDHQGTAVYYGIALNELAYKWVTSCDLYRFGCSAQLADLKGGVDLVKNYPQLAFPTGSVELKTAWKVLTDDEKKLATFYTVTGQITPDDQHPHACKTVDLGLVGMHIVSKTANHPEFVWATFEHKNNAPDCTKLDATAPLAGGWTFFDKTAYDNCKLPHCTNTYLKGSPAIVCREHPSGDSNLGHYPDGNDCSANPGQRICQPAIKQALASNTAAMVSINASASAAIGQSSALDKVWANYELVGNLWSQGGAVPPITASQAGSLSAANTSMETFVQNGQAGITNPYNCVTCHNMVSGDGSTNLPPVGLSHIFKSVKPASGGCKDHQLPKTCAVN